MEECIECGSTSINELEYDPDCYGCCVMECDDCDAQFERAEMVGVSHECGL
jgi:hypothetical protein